MPDRHGPKSGRLSDLVREGTCISITCGRCRRQAELVPADLMARYGDMPLEAINRAASCGACGSRAFDMQVVAKS